MRSTIQFIFGIVLLLLSSLVPAQSYYRWQDSQGIQHYTDESPPKGTTAERVTIESGHGFYRVARVYDGDTVRLESGEKVRLLGINTPEVAHRNRPAEPGGEAATLFLRQLIEGKLVRLEYGPERHDKYQRLLAHLFTQEGENINARLLSEGYAHAVVKLPNIRLIEEYFRAEKEAQTHNRGIWALPQFQIVAIEDAKGFRNSFRRLSGVVNRVEEKHTAWLLHFSGGAIGLIRKEHLTPFIREGRHPRQLLGKQVTIRGWIHQSKGAPLIRLYHPRMLESVDSGG